ncbi:predicted endonuclease related to Holliday junction resolvase [Chthonomonas calidirosea]|uniref:restriction endonuclease n=1 Tax=Chthonomonas calidirosea TaxID=454171 RepID=UPI0006DD52F0|nr:restriction endonuclease [Chthonomonas calidirosea]CEK14023.1 predicted endonuclease related to Holliday junction resolvase [Chthonomonas calidirosea]
MARRRKRRYDDYKAECLPRTMLAFILSGILSKLLLFFLSSELFRCFLIFAVFVGLPALYFFVKVYPHWVRMERLRCLRLADVDTMSGHTFEHYVARLMEHQGFKTTVTKGSGDLGVDIIARKNGVSYAVQCKRSSDNIPRNAVSDAVAGKQHYGCQEAMVVTNRYFTSGAKELARSTHCVLVDRETLALWIQSFQRRTLAESNLQQTEGNGRISA